MQLVQSLTLHVQSEPASCIPLSLGLYVAYSVCLTTTAMLQVGLINEPQSLSFSPPGSFLLLQHKTGGGRRHSYFAPSRSLLACQACLPGCQLIEAVYATPEPQLMAPKASAFADIAAWGSPIAKASASGLDMCIKA